MDILIEEQNGGLWAAALKEGRLEGLEIDPAEEEVRWGSIYQGRVKSVNKALDAVFVDLDGLNTGILYNRDVRRLEKDGSYSKGGAQAIGKSFRSGDLVTVQAKSTYMPAEDDEFASAESKMVQVSMDITLPGRYLIFCPFMKANRISARIGDKKLRTQLTKMMDQMDGITGCILRSAAAGTQTDILRREHEILVETWNHVELFLTDTDFGLIMLGPDAIQRTLSDHAAQHITGIELTTMDHYHQVEDWCQVFAPDLMTKIDPVELKNATEDLALFHYRDIMGQIEALLQPYTLLPNGGNIIIQDTAALTAVDVNKGGDKRSNLALNVEAAEEIARQIRLRNTGGMILIDFLRAQNKAGDDKVMQALEAAIAQDPCTVQIHGKTALGLTEITRRRRTPPLHERFQGELD